MRATTSAKQSATPSAEPLAVRVPQAAHLLSMSQRSVWSLIAKGQLQVAHVGGITLVLMTSIHALLHAPGTVPRRFVRRLIRETADTTARLGGADDGEA